MNYLILGILPYVTVLVFAVAMIYRIRIWLKVKQPAAMTLFPSPAPGTGTLWGVIRESFFMSGLFKGDKGLWFLAWLFHATLALIFVGHIRVFTDFPRLWAALGINADTMSAVSGGIAGVLVLILAVALLIRRALIGRVREVTNVADVIALLLIVAILITGDAMRFGTHFDLALTRTYFTQLTTFSLASAAIPNNPMFTLHFLLAQLLIVFIPFSKIMHFGGIFFTQTLVQKA